MKALTIRQPWAWLILNGYKDVENRIWSTDYRGPLVIHADGSPTTNKQDDALLVWAKYGIQVPEDLDYGGIVGVVDLIDCADESDSVWFNEDGYAWHLSKPRELPFTPCSGRLKLWDLPPELRKKVEAPLKSAKVQRKRKTPGPREDVAILDEIEPEETFLWLRKVLAENGSTSEEDLLEMFSEGIDYPKVTPLVKKVFSTHLGDARSLKVVSVTNGAVTLETADLTDYAPKFVERYLRSVKSDWGVSREELENICPRVVWI